MQECSAVAFSLSSIFFPPDTEHLHVPKSRLMTKPGSGTTDDGSGGGQKRLDVKLHYLVSCFCSGDENTTCTEL